MSKKEFERNRRRVYDIYDVPKRKRGREWNIHHIVRRSEGGGNDKGNLFPIPKAIHRKMNGHCEDSGDNRRLHRFIKRKYGGDPYERR